LHFSERIKCSAAGHLFGSAISPRINQRIKESIMFVRIFALALAVVGTNAEAEVYQCKDAKGKTTFSDTACQPGSEAKTLPDRAPVTEQQRLEAQQRSAQMQTEVATQGGASTSGEAPAMRTASANTAENDANAVANCVRDVERQPASQEVKAEMIAACQSAGQNQRTAGRTEDSVRECVRNIERTGASGKDKTRAIALCHGGDVKPERAHRTK
jgi:hypothetical protein